MESRSNNQIKINNDLFEEYHARQRQSTTFLLKCLIVTISIINLTILFFFILFIKQIYTLSSENQSNSKQIKAIEDSNEFKNKIISHHMVNLYTTPSIFNYEYTHVINNEEEYQLLLGWIDGDRYEHFLFTCYIYRPQSYLPLSICSNEQSLIFLVKTTNGNRFGAVLRNFNDRYSENEDNDAFLFNLDTKDVFPIKSNNNAYKMNSNCVISFGEDLYIDKDYFENVNYSNFPSNYGNSKNILKDLIGDEENNFKIKHLEIFTRYSKDYRDCNSNSNINIS